VRSSAYRTLKVDRAKIAAPIAATMVLSVLATQLPLLVAMLAVQWVAHGDHGRATWRKLWAVLDGLFPMLVAFQSSTRSERQTLIIMGVMTILFISGVFLLTFRSAHWCSWLVAGLIFSGLLALLAHRLIASWTACRIPGTNAAGHVARAFGHCVHPHRSVHRSKRCVRSDEEHRSKS
jgi:hypothetical protein